MSYTPKTGKGNAYEQGNYTGGLSLVSDIFIDSDKLPNFIPEANQLDSDGFYSIQVNNRPFKILQKVTTQPDQISDNVFGSEILKGILVPWFTSTPFPVLITDSDGLTVPLGLVRSIFDPIGGNIVFNDNIKRFKAPLTISFWRYTGRTSLNSFIDTSGYQSMSENYNPLNNKDVTTKDYVDSKFDDLTQLTVALHPSEPNLLKKVKTISTQQYPFVLDNVLYPVIYRNNPLDITFEDFYIPDASNCSIRLYIDNNLITEKVVENRDLSNPVDGVAYSITTDFFDFKVMDFSYLQKCTPKDWFYIANNFRLTVDYEDIPNILLRAIHQLVIEVESDGETYQSDVFEFGVENPNFAFECGAPTYTLSNTTTKWISGVPSIVPGTVLTAISGLRNYNNFKGTKGVEISLGNKTFTYPVEDTYTELRPLVELETNLELSYDFEGLQFNIKAYNFKDELIIDRNYSIDLRVDTCSELERVTCGDSRLPTTFGQNYSSLSTLTDNFELQKLHGLYKLPNQNFTIYNTLAPYDLSRGPNYTSIEKNVRYVLFKKASNTAVHGLVVKIKDLSNAILVNSVPQNFTVQVKTNSTGWLSLEPFYIGVPPTNDEDRCLVAALSQADETSACLRVTFGETTYTGDFYIRVGILQGYTDLSFSGIDVEFL